MLSKIQKEICYQWIKRQVIASCQIIIVVWNTHSTNGMYIHSLHVLINVNTSQNDLNESILITVMTHTLLHEIHWIICENDVTLRNNWMDSVPDDSRRLMCNRWAERTNIIMKNKTWSINKLMISMRLSYHIRLACCQISDNQWNYASHRDQMWFDFPIIPKPFLSPFFRPFKWFDQLT